MKKTIYSVCLGMMVVTWGRYSLHFFGLLEPYARSGIISRIPLLYVATESWGMACLIVASFLGEKWIRTVLSWDGSED